MVQTKQVHVTSEKTKRFELRLPESMYHWLKGLAMTNGNSMSLQALLLLESKKLEFEAEELKENENDEN